jgi:hypothetical protein
MKMMAKLTRAQLDALVYVGVLAVLWAISSLFNVPVGVDRDRAAMASTEVTTLAAGVRNH